MTDALTSRHHSGGEAPTHASEDPHAVPASTTRRPSTFEEIFEREVDWVVRTLRRLGVGAADVEDVAQQLFVAVLGRMSERSPSQPVRPWLFAFALRAAANHRRLARHRREVLDEGRGAAEATATSLPTPEDNVSRSEDRALLLAALDELDLVRRAVVVMHDLDEMSAPVIASALGVPLNTVYSRIRLGRAELEAAIHRLARRAR